MDIRKNINWQEHKILPHYAKSYEKDLKTSIKQLRKLKETQSKPYMLNEGIIEQIEDFHKSQNAYNHVLALFLNLPQCLLSQNLSGSMTMWHA